jgi:inner membrane protein
MDSLTQIVLGAAIGEAVGGRKMGVKAPFWGGVAGTIPDLDVFLNGFYHPIEAALVHRGFSHSIVFAVLFSPVFAWILYRLYKRKYECKTWLLLFFFGIITHPILDAFTNYGTSLLWPSPVRLSLDSVFVIDPLYTIPFLLCVLIAICMKRIAKWRSRINWIGIVYSSLYLVWGLIAQYSVSKRTDEYFAQSEVTVDRTIVSAMPATTFYWMILGESAENYYINYKSIFGEYKPEDLEVIPKNHGLLEELKWKKGEEKYSELLKFISKGYYTIVQEDSLYNFYDLRFGTATKLTNGRSTTPVFGFGLIVDNGIVDKTERIRNRGAFSQLNFDVYWNNIFAKYE